MRIIIRLTNEAEAPAECERLIRKAIRCTLRVERINCKCTVSVLICGPERIRELNSRMRQVDAVTDVLSFPAQTLQPGQKPRPDVFDHLGVCLGDMAINLDRARQQAEQFGHSVERETAYLAVHSMLHLLGYDHMDEGEQKKLMRSREEAVLATMHLPRQED